MEPVFIDELTARAQGGSGGNGCVNFASRKYQPFGGPDGGDGGQGGDVVIVGSRAVDSLGHLRQTRFVAEAGQVGESNARAGASASDLELSVPPGTIAYQLPAGRELGAVISTNARVVLARGGRGGKGNIHYATGGRRAPKEAEAGKEGQRSECLLRYRIYADTALLEPVLDHTQMLAPKLLERDFDDADWELYRRKPRWIRIQREYRPYDVAYLPADLKDDGALEVLSIAHLYWAASVVINLLPVEELAGDCWQALSRELHELPFRRCKNIAVLASERLFEPWMLENEEEAAEVSCVAVSADDDSYAVFAAQLTGGTVK